MEIENTGPMIFKNIKLFEFLKELKNLKIVYLNLNKKGLDRKLFYHLKI